MAKVLAACRPRVKRHSRAPDIPTLVFICHGICLIALGRPEEVHTFCVAQNMLLVEVEASVTRPEEVTSNQTNTFLFYFHTSADKRLKRVLPSTLEEAAHVHSLGSEGQHL